jgi:hypothetical protein
VWAVKTDRFEEVAVGGRGMGGEESESPPNDRRKEWGGRNPKLVQLLRLEDGCNPYADVCCRMLTYADVC